MNVRDLKSFLGCENINDFNFSLASPEVIASWSHGSIFKPDIFDLNTKLPVVGGLFCPKVFGVDIKAKCLCGNPGVSDVLYCSECSVSFVPRRIAKFRFGHIDLATPLIHTWFCKSAISVLTLLTELSSDIILKIINCDLHIVISPIAINMNQIEVLSVGQLINNTIHANLWPTYHYALASGGEAMLFLLENVSLSQAKINLEDEIMLTTSVSELKRLKTDYDMINNMISKNIKPQWIALKLLPVMPAVLRPIMSLKHDTYVSSDINTLYGRVINANNALLDMDKIFSFNDSPDRVIYLNLLKELQRALDDLLDTSLATESLKYNSVSLKSLTDSLKGKEGRFRQTLLGRRVDYSGRSVIIPGPSLRLWECGLPIEIALELFKPFILARIITTTGINDISFANNLLSTDVELVTSILTDIIEDRPVILNRAPTLHKLSMLAFKCVLITGKAIRLHPLVCSGFNADFDGDQMAVHVPLSEEAKLEAKDLLLATRNVLHPATGKPSILPSQDMVLGLYYASIVSDNKMINYFESYKAVHNALANGKITLHTRIKFLVNKKNKSHVITSTPGRLFITRLVPEDCEVLYTIEMPRLTKENLYELIEFVFETCGLKRMSLFCEDLMRLGFKFVTKSGLSLCSNDFKPSDYKSFLIKRQRRELSQTICLDQIQCFQTISGLRKPWIEVIKQIEANAELSFNTEIESRTAAQIIINSGSRGTIAQVKQIIGTRGQISSYSGALCKMPILSSYIEGLTPIQFFHSTCASRRGLIDTVLKTATSGYFARKLVEACREYMITEQDCGTTEGINIEILDDDNFLYTTIVGRFLLETVIKDNKTILKKNDLLTQANVAKLMDYCTSIIIRSPITCCALDGLCVMCYGVDLSNGFLARVGDSVGVLAAQAISEPGTQMTLRTFHGLTESKDDSAVTYEDQRLICAPYSGTIYFERLACVRSVNGNTTVANDDAVCMLKDRDKILWKCDLRCGDFLLAYNGERVTSGKLISLRRSDEQFTLALTDGRINIRSDVPASAGVTANSSSVYIEISNSSSTYITEVDDDDELLVSTGSQVNVFDQITSSRNISPEVETSDLEEGLARLSKLFDGKPHEIIANLLPTKEDREELKFQWVNNDICIAVLEKLDHDDIESPNERVINLLSELQTFNFNGFVNVFIAQVRAVYSGYGIILNSKHIEVILSQMINEIIVVSEGQSDYKVGDKLTWQMFSKVNENLKHEGLNQVVGARMLYGVTDSMIHRTSVLSDISFEGPVRTLALAAIEGRTQSFSAVKDRVIAGKLPLFGTGLYQTKGQGLSFG